MTVANGEVLRVTLEGTLEDGTIWQNRFTFKASFSGDQSDAGVLSAVDTWLEDLYANVVADIPTAIQLATAVTQVIEWDSVGALWVITRLIGSSAIADSFANASEPLPNQIAPFVIGSTGRPKSKGRKFLPPFGEDRQDAGELISAAATNLGNWALDYISDPVVTGSEVLNSGVVREDANAFWPFATVAASSLLGTQRRRRQGIGI